MSSLASFPNLIGFFSYSRDDDKGSKGALSALRVAIQWELSAQLGRSEKNFRIWQDRAAIPFGTEWEAQIKLGIAEAAFFVPIITPRVVRSEHCAFEFNAFLERERALGRADLIFPILYIPVPELEDEAVWRNDPVLKVVGARQYFDWQEYRPRSLDDPEVQTKIIQFCRTISNALRKPWVSPEELERQRQAAAQAEVEAGLRRRTGEIAAQRLIEEERKRRDEEAAQRAAAAEQEKQAKRENEAFAKAKRAGTIAAIEGFLAAFPAGAGAAEAEQIKAVLVARAAACDTAMASSDPAVLRSFCDTYRNGADVDRVRARLRQLAAPLEPQPSPRPSRSLAIGAALAALLLIAGGGVALWRTTTAPVAGHIVASAGPPVIVPSPPPQPPATPRPAPPLPPAANLDKWAACRPNSQPGPAIGGPAQRATLRLALSNAELGAVAVRSIAISPDGKLMATAGDDQVIRIWDATTFKWIAQITGHARPIYSVAFSDDGKLLASASWDGTVRTFDAHTFAPLQVFRASGPLGAVKQWGVAFEPGVNPRYVDSTGDDGNVWIWDMMSAAPPIKRPSGDVAVRSLSFVPGGDGEFVTAAFDGKIRFFADSGRVDTVTAHAGKVLGIAYSPDAKFVASSGSDSTGNDVKIWNAATRALVASLSAHHGHAVSVAWSADSKRLASGGGFQDPAVRLWDAQTGRPIQSFLGDTKDIEAVAFHPSQQWLISGSEDGTTKIWDIATGKELLSLVGLPDRPGLPGGQYLAYAPNGCYTGSANAANYVKYVTVDAQGHEHDTGDNGKDAMFVPGDATALLLPQ